MLLTHRRRLIRGEAIIVVLSLRAIRINLCIKYSCLQDIIILLSEICTCRFNYITIYCCGLRNRCNFIQAEPIMGNRGWAKCQTNFFRKKLRDWRKLEQYHFQMRQTIVMIFDFRGKTQKHLLFLNQSRNKKFQSWWSFVFWFLSKIK